MDLKMNAKKGYDTSWNDSLLGQALLNCKDAQFFGKQENGVDDWRTNTYPRDG